MSMPKPNDRISNKMPIVSLLVVSLLAALTEAEISNKVGVNYGQLGNNLPAPPVSVHLIQKILQAGRVKLYDANPAILRSLANTSLDVSVMLPNELIPNVSRSQLFSDRWVKSNIVPFYGSVRIRYFLVGNEILTNPDAGTWFNLVPAMRRVKKSLKRFKLHKVKVGTPSAIDVLESSFPPSNGTFRSDLAAKIVGPMLRFLDRTKSFFFLDVYPYFPWAQQPDHIDLDYALFQARNVTYTDPASGLTYTNLFDQMVDAVVFAMNRLGHPGLRVFIAETGWPNSGDFDQIGANVYNAATYNRNVVRKLTTKPAIGTPARPGRVLPSFVFALYNENQKTGPGTERHFGLMYPNGKPVYDIDLSGKTPPWGYKDVLPKPTNNEPYKGKIWCVVAKGVTNRTALGDAISFACSVGNRTCDAIQPGKACFKPDSLVWHSSYAFSSYWAQFRSTGGTCQFNGLAAQTIKDPSFGHCKFPSVTPASS